MTLYDIFISLFPEGYSITNPDIIEICVCASGVLFFVLIGKIAFKIFNV